MPEAPPLLSLTATDLKQWAYCQRIVYYHHVMPVEFAPTWKMTRGRQVEAAVIAMEQRRTFRRYGLDRGERRFGVPLHSARLGLTGKPDLLILTPDACYPVDFKDTDATSGAASGITSEAALAEPQAQRAKESATRAFQKPHEQEGRTSLRAASGITSEAERNEQASLRAASKIVRDNHRLQLAAYTLLAEECLDRPVPAAFIYFVPSKALVRVAIGPRLRATVLTALAEIRAFVQAEQMPEPTPVRARCTGCEFRNYCDDIW